MATTSKIKSIVFKSEWKNPKGGIVFYHDVEFENGDKGQIGTKEKDSLKAGQEITYTLDGNKIKKEMNFPQKAMSSFNDKTGMMVGNAITNACNLFAHGKIEKEKIEATAEYLCEVSIRLKSKFEGK